MRYKNRSRRGQNRRRRNQSRNKQKGFHADLNATLGTEVPKNTRGTSKTKKAKAISRLSLSFASSSELRTWIQYIIGKARCQGVENSRLPRPFGTLKVQKRYFKDGFARAKRISCHHSAVFRLSFASNFLKRLAKSKRLLAPNCRHHRLRQNADAGNEPHTRVRRQPHPFNQRRVVQKVQRPPGIRHTH